MLMLHDHAFPPYHRQRGALVLVTMALLMMLMMIGLTLTDLAWLSEHMVRNKLDRMVAHQAAQAALADAELAIERSAPKEARSDLLSVQSMRVIITDCPADKHAMDQDLCRRNQADQKPLWQTVDISDDSSNSVFVDYGRFTDRRMQVGDGPFAQRLPRYAIEVLPAHDLPEQTASYLYRITAIGFGVDQRTRAVVQSIYRRQTEARSGRLSWREIPNWQNFYHHP